MFGDGMISSSYSFAVDGPSHDPSTDSKRAAANTFFFLRELYGGEWPIFAVLSLFLPQESEATHSSLIDSTCEGGGTHYSTIAIWCR